MRVFNETRKLISKIGRKKRKCTAFRHEIGRRRKKNKERKTVKQNKRLIGRVGAKGSDEASN